MGDFNLSTGAPCKPFRARHSLPSVRTLETIAGERARELRAVLEIGTRAELETLLETTEVVSTKGKFYATFAQATIAGDDAIAKRELFKYPVTRAWYRACFHPMEFGTAKLSIASEILESHGVEYIPAGRGARSPAIEYVNAGDTYASTLMYVSGRGYRVGCWGDIVERGNYE